NHVRRRGRVLDSVAAVSGRGGYRDPGVVERGVVHLGGELRPSVAVRYLRRAEPCCRIDGGGEVGEAVRASLDEQNSAVLANLVRGLDVERDLERPACVLLRV